mgnify:CR=1 FL=1
MCKIICTSSSTHILHELALDLILLMYCMCKQMIVEDWRRRFENWVGGRDCTGLTGAGRWAAWIRSDDRRGPAQPTLIIGVAGGDRRGGATDWSPPSWWGGNGPAGWPIHRPFRGTRGRRRRVRAAGNPIQRAWEWAGTVSGWLGFFLREAGGFLFFNFSLFAFF